MAKDPDQTQAGILSQKLSDMETAIVTRYRKITGGALPDLRGAYLRETVARLKQQGKPR